MADDEGADRALGGARRRARSAVDERDFAEKVAVAEVGDLAPVALDATEEGAAEGLSACGSQQPSPTTATCSSRATRPALIDNPFVFFSSR